MPTDTPRILTEVEREQTRQWLESWRVTGALLEQERVDRMRALTDADAARIACDLWSLARRHAGDDAEGLLPMKALLRKLVPPR